MSAAADGVRGWRIAFLVLCTVGVCLAADLLRLHVNVNTDPDYHSYCAISERVNCDTVSASRYSVQWGLPVALWGLVVYLAKGALAVWGLRSRLPTPAWPFGILFWASAAATLVSVRLYYISHALVESVCPVCVATYLVNVALLLVCLRELRRVGTGPLEALRADTRALARAPLGMSLFVGGLVIVLGSLWIALPPYWEIELSSGPGGLTVGRTPDGHPWIGARNPTVEVVEFSDYQCPHCLRGHEDMRRRVAARPDEIRLIHRNYPLDRSCNPTMRRQLHPYACHYSVLAVCAGEQRRFWEANDFLFANGRRQREVTAAELAATLKLDADALESCMTGKASRQVVRGDIDEGIRIGVRGTPTFVLEGRLYPGRIPEDVLGAALAAGP